MSSDTPVPSLGSTWTRRSFERSGLPPAAVGGLLLGAFVLVLLAQEAWLGRLASLQEDPSLLEDAWIAVAHAAIAAYLLSASVYLEQRRDEGIAQLLPRLDPTRAAPFLVRRLPERIALVASGPIGVFIGYFVARYATPGSADYDPATWSPEVAWHRVLGLVLGFWTARLATGMVIESGRFSDLAASVRQIDLLDLGGLAPFARQGLTCALLAIGTVSVYALFLVDFGYLPFVAGLLAGSVLVGGLTLLLPLRGAREQVRIAKQAELAWIHERMRRVRDRLRRGEARDADSLDELVAWESRVASVNEWPVDASTFGRFGLYLMIPLGSWAGGALVERAVDALLD